MKIRNIIENDIVDDISLYKDIQQDLIEFIREEVKEDYEPSFTFNEFCSMLINNFDGVEEDMRSYFDGTDKPLTDRLFESVMKIARYEFEGDYISIKKLDEILKEF